MPELTRVPDLGRDVHATTILAVRKDGEVAMAGDGQVTIGDTVMKRGAVKIRSMNNGRVLAGFAGGVADALTLFDRFEMQLERNGGNLRKSAVDLAKDWRSDRFLRRLEAQLLLADATDLLLVSGDGEVIEPDDDAVAIGSGGAFALAAARALQRHANLSATETVKSAMQIAAEICIYTNDHITVAAVSGEGGANV